MIALLGKGLNNDGWVAVENLLIRLQLQYTIIQDHQYITPNHSVVLSIGYQRLIDEISLRKPAYGVVVFHSSDLPEGRGWAPLYYTITNGLDYLTQSMFYADHAIDNGPLIAKARYRVDRFMTISDLRIIDDHLTLFLIQKYIDKITVKKLLAAIQKSENATYWPRRRPYDSAIDPETAIIDNYDFLRALPDHLPAFFYLDNVRVELKLHIDYEFEFDRDRIELIDFSSEIH